MRQLRDYTDKRLKGICIHCGQSLDDKSKDMDHAPSKSLLNPHPENPPTVEVHKKCNAGFSLDEEYLASFLASVICGSTEPDPIRFPTAAGALRHSSALRRRIDQARCVQGTLWGAPEIQWVPEIERVSRVLVKNAKGYAFYELGEPMLAEPSWVVISPLSALSPTERESFERITDGTTNSLWPEVGSVLMQRMAFGDLQPGGWIEVQPSTYRYAVSQESDRVQVMIVLREYLAAEVLWDESSIG